MLLQNIGVLMKSPKENFSIYMRIPHDDSIKSINISNLNYISPHIQTQYISQSNSIHYVHFETCNYNH